MTPERFKRLKQVLDQRQPDLTVVMENVHKAHNLAAIVRNCDAVGIYDVHAIASRISINPNKDIASGSHKWVNIHVHADLKSGIELIKDKNMQLIAAHPGNKSIDFREVDYTHPTAIMLGTELYGLSETALKIADQQVVIPMLGMVDSLNVSVAAALILFEAQRQRQQAGLYIESRLDPEVYRKTLFEWTHPKLASLYKQHHLPYPDLSEEGDVLEEDIHIKARIGQT